MATQKKAEEQNTSQDILLADISIGTNPRTEFDQEETKELAESIKVHGVLQAIRVRPITGGKHKYELVFGERRYRASLLAGRKTIPAVVKVMTDDEVMDVQIVENLQRKDISFLEEASFFQKILATGRINVEELGKRIGKEKDYINRRIRLMDLIPEFKEMLKKEKILYGHAQILYKLPAHEQLAYYNELKKQNGLDIIHLQTVSQLEDDINQNVIRKLDAAKFNIKDAKLVPEAGACIACIKCSTVSPDLFGLDKGSSRCFDKTCFANKTEVAFTQQLEAAINDPNVTLVEGWMGGKDAQALRKKGHDVLCEYTHFNTCSASTPGAKKSFTVSGQQRGATGYILIKPKAGAANSVKKKTPKELAEEINVAKINGRLQDARIIQEKIVTRFETVKQYNFKNKEAGNRLNPIEMTCLNLILLSRAGEYNFEKELKVKDGNYFDALYKAKDELRNRIMRTALNDFMEDAGLEDIEGNALRKIAESYFPKEIAQWEKEQEAVRKQREAKLAGNSVEQKPIAKSKSK